MFQIRILPLILAAAPALAQPCSPGWSDDFPGGAILGNVHAILVRDEPGAPVPQIYAAGSFLHAGGVPANRIARWDGHSWSALGSGTAGDINDLVFFEDGTGESLYAAGAFTVAGGGLANRIVRWDGASWLPLGAGLNNRVSRLIVFDDGTGAALYAGGNFTSAGGQPAAYVARWNGSDWSSVGEGFNGPVHDFTIIEHGPGPALLAAGALTMSGGTVTSRIARWTGSEWVAFSGEINSDVNAIEWLDLGSGPTLFIGGRFTFIDGQPINRVAQWDGSSWQPLGSGMGNFTTVGTLTMFDDGQGGGPQLYAGGSFVMAGGVPARFIARWDGTAWGPVGPGWTSVGSGPDFAVGRFATYADAQGGGGGLASRPVLFAGGGFIAGVAPPSYLQYWDGVSWAILGTGLDQPARAIEGFDDGSGPALYIGGGMGMAASLPARRVARWTPRELWSPLGGGVSNLVNALRFFDDGQGPALFVGGLFSEAGSTPVNNIARWDGAAWSPLGSGVESFGTVYAIAVYDDGGGPQLYVGGSFSVAGGAPAGNIARWNGSAWSSLGQGLNERVWALAVYDDGQGPALYASGQFHMAGGQPANHIARWDGTAWSALGAGTFNPGARALAVFDDGSGEALYAGGGFAQAGGIPAQNIARWDGSSWSALGPFTFSGFPDRHIEALAVFDDGSGPALYAGGAFTRINTTDFNYIASWDGLSWSHLGQGMNDRVEGLHVFNDGRGEALFAAGRFTMAGGRASGRIARWGCIAPPVEPCYANCDGSTTEPILTVDDFTCFINEFAAAQSLPVPEQIEHYANCDGSTTVPVLTVDDFVCFVNAYAMGCG